MLTGSAYAPRYFGLLAAAGLLLALPVPAFAQQTYTSPEQASMNPPKKQVTVKQRPAQVQGLSDYWGGYQNPKQGSVQRRAPDVIFTNDGRVKLQDGSGGTVGFASTRSNIDTLYDGSTVPGIDPNSRSGSSAAGMSVTVNRSDNVLLAPLTILGGPPTW